MNIAGLGNLEQGDLIMLIQVQGVTVDDTVYTLPNYTNSSKFFSKWGQIIDLDNCGNYEFVQVRSVPNASSITLDCALANDYTALGKVIIVRVPRYSSLTVTSAGTITCPAWNGTTGGVVSVEVNGNTTIDAGGNIDVSALGFRGGQFDFQSTFNGARYADQGAAEGAEKGEGIAGSQTDYDNFNDNGARYCRGAAANAGGGGTCHNAGGGGGANAGNISNWNNAVSYTHLTLPTIYSV